MTVFIKKSSTLNFQKNSKRQLSPFQLVKPSFHGDILFKISSKILGVVGVFLNLARGNNLSCNKAQGESIAKFYVDDEQGGCSFNCSSVVDWIKRQQLLRFIVLSYKAVGSVFFGGSCGFVPTCSDYALECIDKMGPFRAIFYIFKRVLKCHPFHVCGYDPVPEGDSCKNKIL